MANLKQIERFLKDKKIAYEVIDLGGEVFTVDEVKKSGVKEGDIVKTLVIRVDDDFVALAVRGQDRLDFRKVRKHFGPSTSLRVNCELAKPEEVEKAVGVPVGAVCPILIGLPLYIDKEVMELAHINMGSGDLKFGLEMEFADFLKAIEEFQVEDLVL